MNNNHNPSALFRLRAFVPEPRLLWTGLAGAVGLFLGTANPLLHIPILVLLYPAALALLGYSASNRTSALRRGWLCGLAGASAALYWIAMPVYHVARQPLPLAAACAMLLGAYIGLYGGLFSVLAQCIRHFTLWRRIVLLGIAWFLLEYFRNWFLTGFPWLPLAAAFVPWPAWIQAASVLGAYGLGGLFAAVACLGLAGLTERGTRLTAALSAAVCLLVLVAFGLWRLHAPLQSDAAAEIPVALIQGNIDQNQKWDLAVLEKTLNIYMNISEETSKNTASKPQLVIWPETAMPFDYRTHPFAKRIRTHVMEQNFWLLFGAPGEERGANTNKLFNRAHLISPDGRSRGMYEKEDLVPFGEYVPPWLDLEFLRPLLQGIGDFTPGRNVKPLFMHPDSSPLNAAERAPQSPLALGVLICYETIFPELSRQRVADGAQVLINISNDAWFGRTSAPEQHVQLSALRAVEQERYLARGTNTGISAIVDPRGRIVARGGLFLAEAVLGVIRPSTTRTVFFYIAPWMPWAGLCLFIALTGLPLRRFAHNAKTGYNAVCCNSPTCAPAARP